MARFFIRGKTKVVFAPSVASKPAPTRAEINAGTILANPGVDANVAIADMPGFEARNNPITAPDLNSSFDKQFPGTDSADNPSIVFYDDDTSTTIRTALAKGTFGYLIIMRYGDVATKRAQVWPVRVAAMNDDQNLGNELAKFTVQMSPEGQPEQNAVIPA